MSKGKIVFKTTVVHGAKEKVIKELSGKYIKFNLLPVGKEKRKKATTLITGQTINFTLQEKGLWRFKEKKPEVCMICKLPIKEGQRTLRCPMCQSIFHDDHIFEWLKVKGKCPVCMQKLQSWQLEERNKN